MRSDHAGGCQPAVRNALAASIAAWIARGVWPADLESLEDCCGQLGELTIEDWERVGP